MTKTKPPRGARGYASGFIEQVKAADATLVGVQLGRLCVAHSIPAAWVAARVGVTRTMVYRWFVGGFSPQGERLKKVQTLLARLQRELT